MSFSNPVPVAVAIVPYDGKLIAIRRGIEPKKGEIAFPGGYINSGETFHQALSRELFEETGIKVSDSDWDLFCIGDSIQSNRILIFGKCKATITEVDFKFKSNETLELTLVDENAILAFPLHNEAKNKYFAK